MLDGIFKFGGKHEWHWFHHMWASSNFCNKHVCASARVIYNHVTSDKYRCWCQCCRKNVHSYTSSEYNTLHDIMFAIPYASITHQLARQLRLYSSEIEYLTAKDYHFQGTFKLQPKYLNSKEMDDSIIECIPDSFKLDNANGVDSLLLSALKNDKIERSVETVRSWKRIVTFIFGTQDELSQIKNTLLLQ